jgi:hypothetical protein
MQGEKKRTKFLISRQAKKKIGCFHGMPRSDEKWDSAVNGGVMKR